MTPALLYAIAGLVLFCRGLYAMIVRERPFWKIMAANVMGAGVFMFLVALALGASAGAPDPVPHSMVLTGIVITVSATAFALALVRRLQAEAHDEASHD